MHPETIAESEAEYMKDKRLYSYPVSSGMTVEFSENELKKDLENTRRVVDIIAHVEIKGATGVIGARTV